MTGGLLTPVCSVVIGFEVAIVRIEAKFQMSRYERVADTSEAVRALEKEGNTALAQGMLDCNLRRLPKKEDAP